MNIVLVLANSEDPDEMLHNAAFHRGIQCLPSSCYMFPKYKRLMTICLS